jgi:imidazolonepropionase-like amidohydrolase
MKTAITGSTLFDGIGDKYVQDSVVLIDGDRIGAVGTRSDTKVPPAYTTVDGEGLFLFPGLINMHSHVSFMYLVGDLEPQYTRPSSELALLASRVCRVLLAQGVTTVRDMGGPGDLHLKVRNAIAAGELLGPRMVACGQPLASTGGHGWHISFEADGPDGLLNAARTQLKRGADFIKIMASDDPWLGRGSEYTRVCLSDDEMRAAFDEVHRWDRLACCHVQGTKAIRSVLEAGADIIDHGTYLTAELAAMMADKGVYFDPTLSAAAQSLHPRFARESRIVWNERHPEVTKSMKAGRAGAVQAADAAGVKFLIGTDTVGCYAEEVQLLRLSGVSAWKTLLACTRWPAEALRLDGEIGTVASGKLADLVAFEGDPITHIEAMDQVRFVMKAGRLLNPNDLLYGEEFLTAPMPALARLP